MDTLKEENTKQLKEKDEEFQKKLDENEEIIPKQKEEIIRLTKILQNQSSTASKAANDDNLK